MLLLQPVTMHMHACYLETDVHSQPIEARIADDWDCTQDWLSHR